ncbi:MAG: sigma-54-dependent Fis family transcriptional regulator, partial [Calditrichaeota bacterium]|nr:sigma-54-dependent Fis family transcriptional regulator [Calditrichota bacterium]
LSIFIIIAYLLVPVIAIAYAYYETVVQNKINLRLLKESSGPEHGYVHAEIERLKQQLRFYEEKTDRSTKSELIEENGILYTSKSPMNRLMHRADEVAKSDLNVLITGPTGTGKELMARHIHLKSSRADKPFIIVHCGALTDTLIESELFGHVKGAFTGASQDKTGRFKLADGGSIFLDEIAETSPAFQVKLLRVIQEGTFEAVGSNETIHVDLRIVAATHRHIKEAVNENKFRDDLYYRLAGYELRLPPLTERTMDIRPLFLSILNQIDRHEEIQLSDALFEWLDKQSWPGNIRQLKMLSERAIVNAKSSNRSHLLPADFELSDSSEDSSTDQTGQLVLSQLRKHQFKHRAISLTAQDLNMHRVTVTEYLRGTIIKQFIRSNYSRDDLLKQIAAGTILDNYEQFEKRILGYLETMLSHIKTAIADKLTVEEIRKRYFTNLPNSFMTDLSNLVNYSKERSSL